MREVNNNAQGVIEVTRPVKEPKTYNEQAGIIRKKGFLVDEEECIAFLHRVNYYRLSAYFLPFKNDDGSYQQNIDFKRVEHIYDFDACMRSILFRYIEEIELYLRTQLSYAIVQKYGPLGYLYADNFSIKHNHEKFNELLKRCISENKHSLVVKHHEKYYGGKYPLWVIIEFFSMGMLSYFYADLKTEDQKPLAKGLYSVNPECMMSWLRCLTELRNLCAHSMRLYFRIFSSQPKTLKQFGYKFDRSLFSQIVMLKFLYPQKDQWNSKIVNEIESLVEEFSMDISLEHIGFPENWKNILKTN